MAEERDVNTAQYQVGVRRKRAVDLTDWTQEQLEQEVQGLTSMNGVFATRIAIHKAEVLGLEVGIDVNGREIQRLSNALADVTKAGEWDAAPRE